MSVVKSRKVFCTKFTTSPPCFCTISPRSLGRTIRLDKYVPNHAFSTTKGRLRALGLRARTCALPRSCGWTPRLFVTRVFLFVDLFISQEGFRYVS
jgi:hypothetical protein